MWKKYGLKRYYLKRIKWLLTKTRPAFLSLSFLTQCLSKCLKLMQRRLHAKIDRKLRQRSKPLLKAGVTLTPAQNLTQFLVCVFLYVCLFKNFQFIQTRFLKKYFQFISKLLGSCFDFWLTKD